MLALQEKVGEEYNFKWLFHQLRTDRDFVAERNYEVYVGREDCVTVCRKEIFHDPEV